MARKRHTPEQIIAKLREAEVELAKDQNAAEVCRKLSITELTLGAHTAGRPETTGRMFSVVAGAGFEPTTSGL